MRRFYSGALISAEIDDTKNVRFFGTNTLPLAELASGDLIILSATNQKKTAIFSIAPNVIYPQAYSPYGHRVAAEGSPGLLEFNGERAEPASRNYLLGLGYRSYNPTLMRLHNPDSWSPFGLGGLNAYSYCLGDPVNYSDPSGHILFNQNTQSSIARWRARAQINLMYRNAHDTKSHIDNISKTIAATYNGATITPPLKTKDRILEKAFSSYNGKPGEIQDIARNTITVKQKHINSVVRDLEGYGASVHRISAEGRADGYSGVHAFIKGPSGIWGEIQVQPPSMIFSRYSSDITRATLGSQHYGDLANRARMHGYEGGMAHHIYEQARSPNSTLAQQADAIRESRDYYTFMRDGYTHL